MGFLNVSSVIFQSGGPDYGCSSHNCLRRWFSEIPCLRKDRVFLLGNIEINSVSSPWTRNQLYSSCCMRGYASAKVNPSQYLDSFIMANISVSEYQKYKVLAISWEPCTAEEDIWRMYGKGSSKIHWFIAPPSHLQQILIKLLRNCYWILRRNYWSGGGTTLLPSFLGDAVPTVTVFLDYPVVVSLAS